MKHSLLMLTLILLIGNVSSSDCETGGLFPKLLGSAADDANSRYQSIVSSEDLNAVFMGGFTASQDLYTYDFWGDPLAVVARIDLDTNLYVFKNVYEGSNLETVSGLALNPDSTRLAVHAIEFDSGDWDYRSYVFVVSASDGSFYTKMARV